MKKTFLLLFVFALAAVGLLAMETTGNSRGPDASISQSVAVEKVNVQKANVETNAVQAALASPSESEPRTADNLPATYKRTADIYTTNLPTICRQSADIALSARTIIQPHKALEPARFKYQPKENFPKLNYTSPDIASFNGFGSDNSARAKI